MSPLCRKGISGLTCLFKGVFKFTNELRFISWAEISQNRYFHSYFILYTYGLLTKCEVKMAGYWPSSFFACLWTETKSRSINSFLKSFLNWNASLCMWSVQQGHIKIYYVSSEKSNSAAYNVIDFLQYETLARYLSKCLGNSKSGNFKESQNRQFRVYENRQFYSL